MCEAANAYIVVPIEAETLRERLRCVLFALVSKLFRAFAKVSIEYALQSLLPRRGQFLGVALGNSFNVRGHYVEKLVEVVERIALWRARGGHCVLGAEAVVDGAVERVIRRTAL